MFIYKVTNTVNNNFYIGKTQRSVEKRFSEHLLCADRGEMWCVLHRAIRKYGKENFIVETISQCNNIEQLNGEEVQLIEQLRPHYNTAPGGQGGALRIGVTLSKETREKISNSHKGKKASEETKEKMRVKRLGIKPANGRATEKMIEKCSKTYIFENEGEEITITNLNKYCRENGLCRASMRALYYGKKQKYKTYRRYSS